MSTTATSPCTFDQLHACLPSILQNIPQEWRGTTFKNSHLLGREVFSHDLCQLVASRSASSPPQIITTQDLLDLGNAEDYLRVASNISCLLETYLALKQNFVISQVFTFASSNLSIISVLLTSSGTPVHLYLSSQDGRSPFSEEHLRMLSLLSTDLHIHQSSPPSSSSAASTTSDAIILAYESTDEDVFQNPLVDGIIGNNNGILFIKEITKIIPSKILTIRKRLATPMTSPIAENLLNEAVGLPIQTFEYTQMDLQSFQTHLQTLSGTPPNLSCPPICYTAGLPAVCSLWMTLVASGGADIVMASTSYGGSSELTDIISSKAITPGAGGASLFRKHKFDITGSNEIIPAIRTVLTALQSSPPENLLPRTVLFLEIPTNPDMKVPSMIELATMLLNYQQATGKSVLLLIDATFAPNSQVLSKVESQFPELTTMVFISMSKSISRGMTTAGTLIAGSSPESCELLNKVQIATEMFDTGAKADQIRRLIDNHVGVEQRCVDAYQNALYLGKVLQDVVTQICPGGYQMPLAFVTEENASHGFTSSTFSFNLPSVSLVRTSSTATAEKESEENALLAQRFVDLLCEHSQEFKPCVSFGQDNGLVYATVPATSTQGAIHPDDKAKQAIGGVQLTRLSFPPLLDIATVEEILKKAVKDCYGVVG
jgi:cystathionine beta-lyase/cystathionine gamma-synthase